MSHSYTHCYTADYSDLGRPCVYIFDNSEIVKVSADGASAAPPVFVASTSALLWPPHLSVPLCPVALTTDRHLSKGFLGDQTEEDFPAVAPPVNLKI